MSSTDFAGAAESSVSMKLTLYIPYVKVEHEKSVLEKSFQFAGNVKRVDFTPIKNFNTKEINPIYKHAFIHFDSVNDDEKTRSMLNWIYEYEYVVMNFPSEKGDLLEYWKVYIAENPIPETELNIHQLANNYHIIDDKVIDMEHDVYRHTVVVEQLEERIQTLEDENNRILSEFETLKNFVFSQLDMFSTRLP